MNPKFISKPSSFKKKIIKEFQIPFQKIARKNLRFKRSDKYFVINENPKENSPIQAKFH